MSNNAYTIISLFYNIFILVIYFSRKKLKNIETNIYSKLVLVNFITIVTALLCFFTILNRASIPVLNDLVSKFLLVCFLGWVLLFTDYVYVISYSNKENFDKNHKKVKSAIWSIFFLALFFIYTLPLLYYGENNIAYSFGPSANVVYILTTLSVINWVIICLKNFKNLKNKKYLPVLVFIMLIIVVVVAQKINPALLLVTAMETYVTVIMYFTIENPDLKMLRNYHEAKQYAEDLNTEKQMFIYNISQDMKIPLLKTSKFCEQLQYSEDLNEYKNGIRNIKSECNSMIQKINSIFDIDASDIRDLGTDNTKYNLNNLLKLSVNNMKQNILKSEKKIEFINSISDTLPKELIGDSTRIKQVLNIIFENALEHTKEGFIEFKVQGLNKGNICRLLISLEDSGEGIEAEKLNTLFDRERIIDKTKPNEDRIDPNKENLALAKRIISLLGGNLIVSSNLGVGTKISIVLDQEIVDENIDDIDKYEKKYFEENIVLVLGADDEERKMLMRKIADIGGIMETADSINEVIGRLKKHKKYFAIIVDGDMPYYNIVQISEKLKNIKGFNSNIIALSKDKEMKSAKNRAMIGIQGYIARPLNNEDIESILTSINK